MSNRYPHVYAASLRDPDSFWLGAANALEWIVRPTTGYSPISGWFADGILNTCHNALDRHVAAGHGERPALIYESPVADTLLTISYAEMLDQVARTAGMLVQLGVRKGDRIIIYMPMIPETVMAMLACARIGAIHSVVFGGFAPPELAKRIDDARPRLLLTASCGIEGQKRIAYQPLVNQALDLATHQVEHVVILQRAMEQAVVRAPRDLDWQATLATASAVGCVPLASADPLYILYTSGTTGTPKGVVRDNGGHAVALAWSMAGVYDVHPGDTFWAASDVGWVVGHSYIVYAPLLVGATSVLFEGKPVGTSDAGAFWRIIDRHGVDVFFTAPTAIRAIRKADPDAIFLKEIGTNRLRAMFLAGERADPDTLEWAETALGVPVIDHWWQTELGWPAAATCLGLGDDQRKRGSAGFPVPGFAFSILSDAGHQLEAGASGHIAIARPLPPGCFTALWENPAGFNRSFAAFPGHYETGDAGYIDSDGFVHVMGRTDDIINVAGHRLSTGQMEEIVTGHPAVAECAVIGIDDAVKGTVPIALAVARAGQRADANMTAEIDARVRGELGAIASLHRVHIVHALPKTRSGKILRRTLRAIANGVPTPPPATIEDATVLDEYRTLFARESGR